MEYRRLGRTGLRVSALGFGASSLGGVFREIDEKEGIRAVHTAVDLGVNFIDVSPFYGFTKAERVLGEALKTIPRDRYVLETKVGRYGMQMEDFDFAAERVTRSVDESLSRLKVDYVDIILCHDIEFGDLTQVLNETIPALRRVQETGKARFVGVSGLPLQIFRRVLDQTDLDVVLSYCHYSLNDTALEGLLPYLDGRGMGVINASPLSMGLLSDRGAPEWHPASDEIRQTCAKAAAFCRGQGVDIAQLAIRFSVSNPALASTLVSTADPRHMEKNVRWAEAPLDRSLLAQVLEILKPIHNQTWPSGRPENQWDPAGDNDPVWE
jgi:L-galactose dehydrogenase